MRLPAPLQQRNDIHIPIESAIGHGSSHFDYARHKKGLNGRTRLEHSIVGGPDIGLAVGKGLTVEGLSLSLSPMLSLSCLVCQTPELEYYVNRVVKFLVPYRILYCISIARTVSLAGK